MLVRRGECVSFAPWSMAEECIMCPCSDSKLAQCKDIPSWTTLYRAYVIRNHKPILEAPPESEFLESIVKYHRNCRAEFANKSDLQTKKPSDDAATGTCSYKTVEEAIEIEISQNQWVCLVNTCFVKSQSTSQTRRPERSFTVCRKFAPTS